MKRFLTRACAKIGRFFWSWGFLKFMLWTATLIVLLYAEEDWRGARLWAATKAEWEAKGESLDYNKFIPLPVPDDQNLAAIPLFRQERDPKEQKSDTSLYPLTLRQAMRQDLPGNNLSIRNGWQRGELFDMKQFHQIISTDYAEAFKGVKPPGDTLAQFEALYPFLADLRAAAETRPLCRFDEDYTVTPPSARALSLLVGQLKLSRILTLHAILALDHHQPDLALADLKTNDRLISGVKRDPTLIGGLLAIAMTAVGNGALYDGLAAHAWNDAQLAELQEMLRSHNFVADYQFAFRGEAVEDVANMDYFKNSHLSPLSVIRLITGMSDQPNQSGSGSAASRMIGFLLPWPGGWWDMNKSRMASFLFHELATVNPQSLRVFPKVSLDLEHQLDQARMRWSAIAPWNIFFTISSRPLDDVTQKFAQAQVWVDETRIACALERYHLAHGAYPASLDALAPASIDELPHDIMNGEPYHYRLRPDGTFLLYSVGWNQTDDGGKVAYLDGNPLNQPNPKEGDWVWPTPQTAQEK